MAFAFMSDQDVVEQAKRIAMRQIRQTRHQLCDRSLKRTKRIHHARRDCKKLRGLLRLIRCGLGEAFKEQDRWLRDTARELSELRDAQTVFDAYVALVGARHASKRWKDADPVFLLLKRRRRKRGRNKRLVDQRLKVVCGRLTVAESFIGEWSLEKTGFRLFESGLVDTYRRAARAMKLARESGSANGYHDWRKQVKYHGHHCQLLVNVWPEIMSARASEVERLGSLLGDEHDLTVLSQTLRELLEKEGSDHLRQAIAWAGESQDELRRVVHPLGSRLFAEKAKRFSGRCGKYWDAASEIE
jgi:CHAD domain-containing protein